MRGFGRDSVDCEGGGGGGGGGSVRQMNYTENVEQGKEEEKSHNEQNKRMILGHFRKVKIRIVKENDNDVECVSELIRNDKRWIHNQ